MFEVQAELPAGSLTAEVLWAGLCRKVTDPGAFLPAVTGCVILGDAGDTVVREVEVAGERIIEDVALEPPRRVVFSPRNGSRRGRIVNEIDRDADGRVVLRILHRLEIEGLAPGSAEEAAYAERQRADLGRSVRATLEAIGGLQG